MWICYEDELQKEGKSGGQYIPNLFLLSYFALEVKILTVFSRILRVACSFVITVMKYRRKEVKGSISLICSFLGCTLRWI